MDRSAVAPGGSGRFGAHREYSLAMRTRRQQQHSRRGPGPHRGLGLALLVGLWLAPLAGLILCPSALQADEEQPKAPAVPIPAPGTPKPEDAGTSAPLVFGAHPISTEQVVDGDTIRIQGQPSVRILCLDTEELYRRASHKEAAERDFAAYAREMRGDRLRPAKFGTPAGEAAKRFAAELVKGATKVRLERDAVGAPEVDPYGRRLAHVILETEKGDVLFAEAMIRAGHSPYFIKYGGSLRFDARFRAAEKAAREAKYGIWGDAGPAHYPDYAERLAWWQARLAQVKAWRKVAAQADHVTLGETAAAKKLAALVGKKAVVRGLFSRALETKDKSRRLIFMGHRPKQGFPLVFFDREVYAGLDMPAIQSMYVTVTGTISLYRGRPQMVVERADQISTK